MVKPRRAIGKSRSQQVRRVYGGVRRKRWNGISPGERIGEQPVQQNQRRSGPGAQIAHAGAIDLHPTHFHAIAQDWRRARGNLRGFIHYSLQNFMALRDNSFFSTGVYLEERLCRFTLGSFGSPFFVVLDFWKTFDSAIIDLYETPSAPMCSVPRR
jgi:hypothetical protein